MLLVTLRQRLHLFLAGHTGLTWVSVTLLWSSMKHLGSHGYIGSFFGFCRAADRALLRRGANTGAVCAAATYNMTHPKLHPTGRPTDGCVQV